MRYAGIVVHGIDLAVARDHGLDRSLNSRPISYIYADGHAIRSQLGGGLRRLFAVGIEHRHRCSFAHVCRCTLAADAVGPAGKDDHLSAELSRHAPPDFPNTSRPFPRSVPLPSSRITPRPRPHLFGPGQ